MKNITIGGGKSVALMDVINREMEKTASPTFANSVKVNNLMSIKFKNPRYKTKTQTNNSPSPNKNA